jgi:predicted peroxiredoxin
MKSKKNERAGRLFDLISRRNGMEQDHREEKDRKELSRQDFLKAAGIAGLGMAGLGAMMSSPAAAQEAKDGKKGKYVIVITHGGNNPNRAIWALLMAETIQKKGLGDVHVWMTIEGADLCKKSVPEKIVSPIFSKFGNAMEIMDRVRKNGCKFGVCPPCAEYFSAKSDEKFDWVELQGGDWLMKNIQDSWVVWF